MYFMHYEHCNVGYNKHKSFPLAWSRFLQTLYQCTSSNEGGTQASLHSGEGSRQQVCEVHQTDEQLLHPAPPILYRLRRGQLLHTALEDFCVIFSHVSTLYLDSYRLVGDFTKRFLTSAN